LLQPLLSSHWSLRNHSTASLNESTSAGHCRFCTDVFCAFVHSASNCHAHFSNRRHRLLSRSFLVFREFRTPSRATLSLQSALVSTALLVASTEMKPAVKCSGNYVYGHVSRSEGRRNITTKRYVINPSKGWNSSNIW